MGQNGKQWVEVRLARIVLQENSDRQFIFLAENDGQRGFPIVIGDWEASEMHRVVNGIESKRPLTHQLLFNTIQKLGALLKRVEIVELRENTFFAQLVLEDKAGKVCAEIDARPSDAIAVALRARCPIRVAEDVLQRACVQTPETGAPEVTPKESEEEPGESAGEDPEEQEEE